MVSKKSLIKYPLAWFPLVMSLTALGLVVGFLVIVGVPQQPPEDEGTAAHLFQLLMGGQVPIIALFLIKWLPERPKETLLILVLQFIVGLLAFAPVYFFKL